ncbi:hypothetical protein Pmani_008812 [Petrolisthes manimaculis]|uniref:Fibrinogen C-terminal domain-containing protein n=1 Tax=Petrolisthes manimaculis TaxID=1843537 RepID=A0AAE1Q633_9EUCA|nr:hypothetical protein Pmani_008812 [Petrolisthes manimaculis]
MTLSVVQLKNTTMLAKCEMLSVLLLVFGNGVITDVPPDLGVHQVPSTATTTPCNGKDCKTNLVSSFLELAGYNPTCIASCLSRCDQIEESNNLAFIEVLREVMQELKPAMQQCQNQNSHRDREWRWRPRHCLDLLDEGDSGRGVRQVYPFRGRPQEGVDVLCDHTIDNGGWTIFQHRTNLTTRENFTRPWIDYVRGFGNMSGEFWLGLDNLQTFTSWGQQELRIDLSDYEGEHRWAKYTNFDVGPDHYRIKVSGYSGTARDSMAEQNNQQFTTYDADHDTWGSGNCAQVFKGAWWYKSCHHSNLNGFQYEGNHTTYADGINWRYWKGNHYSLMNTTMMFRPRA